MGNVAHCSPTKDFFINMLTRDIDLNDAILDLLDNCLDGAIRSIKSDTTQDVEKKYSGFHADITINNKFFKYKIIVVEFREILQKTMLFVWEGMENGIIFPPLVFMESE